MAAKSSIEWTDNTWNPIVGCSVVSPGCTNCYAMKLAGHRLKNTPKYKGLTQASKSGPVWTGEVRLWEKALYEPLGWKTPRKIFVNSEGDLFHEAVTDDQIYDVFSVMAQAQQHDYQILTKRAARMLKFMSEVDWRALGFLLWPAKCIWLGVSAERQQEADERIPLLRRTPAAVRFISFEPLLGHIDVDLQGIHWAIAGGESGPKARPMHPVWPRRLRNICAEKGVAFFFKQWGEWIDHDQPGVDMLGSESSPLYRWRDNCHSVRIGKKLAGRLLDGKEHNEFPEART